MLRKELAQKSQSLKARLEHMYNWREISEGEGLTIGTYDQAMVTFGTEAEKITEGLAGVAGMLKSRKTKA